MPEENFHNKIAEDIGYIKGFVERMPKIEERLTGVENKVNKILGYAAGVGATFGLMAAFAKDWFRKLYG